ncbi:WD40 repeat-like protein [Lophium mytilinum]|uniref:WD40 repeat-like protein n=1 Tax=Lophium mytilinum TaxID=390894 RepID=A0A6A6QLA5_9PEZI|nr:WD40 repeat-like protein [Lophium mytilinum]
MAGSLPNSSAGPFGSSPYTPAFRAPSMINSSFKIDEGYSEETRSQTGSDTVMRTDSRLGEGLDQDAQYVLPDYILGMSEGERSEFCYAILRSLQTSSIAGLVERLNPLLHLDPVIYLPPEITFQIFSYLEPETLLRASTLSRAWRMRTLDSPLWKLLFGLEGWTSNTQQVRNYEETEKLRKAEMKERKTRARTAEDMDYEPQSHKKRIREKTLFGDGAATDGSIHNRLQPLTLDGSQEGTPAWGEQHGIVEADDTATSGTDDRMQDVAFHDIPGGDQSTMSPQTSSILSISPMALDPPVKPSLILPSPDAKINWQYLYKQKRRLEENWNTGRYLNFQLPHPNHQEEAHTECVYTIQYSGKYLVSGSRDKTIRIWNLDTQRLVQPPLVGHAASVLCLQFDERPEQDIVVTGGSDCHVLLWRFSTGELIKKLEKAHSESVLNLRFDDTYLVTCSKDKTIKVWNRKELRPTDDAYPRTTTAGARFPSYIINMQQQLEGQALRAKVLKPYSLIMTLEGHGAAVNAIQILDGRIVSASGDRSIKVWDVRNGSSIKTFTGHTKGIACVQYDGRRIVSGSSDETVRIFCSETGAEVACLQGHSNLVRTVQAQFSDLPGNEKELAAEAKAIDMQFLEAREKGLVPTEFTREQRRARNAGSRDPKDIFALGAKLPPGGGSSRWARIVSGSYDETVIIWKRETDGRWAPSKTLLQHQAVLAAGGRPRRPATHNQQAAHPPNNQNHAQAPPAHVGVANNSHLHNFASATAQNAAAAAQQVQLIQHAQALQAAAQAGQQAGHTTTVTVNVAATTTNLPPQPAAAATAAPVQPAQGPAQQNPNPAPHHHHHHHHPAPQPVGGQVNSRVFKLQFDARRIICCSQDPTIVGWDFANGDADIIQASQFFGEAV